MSKAAPNAPLQPLKFGTFVVDFRSGQLFQANEAVHLGPKPFAVLCHLAQRPGQLVTKEEMLDAVWGHRFVSESVLTGTINAVRTALGEQARDAHWIRTVPRRGYRFAARATDEVDGVTEAPGVPEADSAASPGAALATPAEERPLADRRGNLPHALESLIGREAAASALREATRHSRLVTLTGPGGVGKTSLMLSVAGEDAPVDGVWLLRLDALDAADTLAPAVARLLGLSESAGVDSHRLGAALAPLQLRLVLDNAEHLAERVAPQVAVWLDSASGLQVWVTSQRPLHVRGEQVQLLPPLSAPAADASLEAIVQSAAVQLLHRRISALDPEWAPGESDWRALAETARALDGLPLALELAAARVPLLGATGVRARLDERLRLLTRGVADAPLRHRTLRAALDWSMGLLPSTAAQLLALCSVFSGGFTLAAIQAVAADVLPEVDEWALLDHLSLLRDMALVLDDGTPPSPLVPARGTPQAEHIALDWFAAPRMRLYDSVRLFGRERLEASGLLLAAQRAHLKWAREFFASGADAQLALAEAVWLGPMEPESANLSVAMGFALEHARQASNTWAGAEAVSLYADAVGFALRSGMRFQAIEWWQAIKERVRLPEDGAPPSSLSPETQAQLDWAHLVLAQFTLARISDGIAAARRQAAHWLAQGARWRVVLGSYMQFLLELRAEGIDAARATLGRIEAALTPDSGIFERRMLPWARAIAAREGGDLQTFARFYETMRDESVQRGDRLETWKASWGLAQAQFLMGDLDRAIGSFDQTMDDLTQAGRERAYGVTAGQGASLRLYRDASAESLRRARQAARLLRSDQLVSYAMGDALPWAAWHQGRVDDARRLQAWSDQMARERGERRGPVSQRLRKEMLAHLGDAPLPAESGLDDEAAVRLALG